LKNSSKAVQGITMKLNKNIEESTEFLSIESSDFERTMLLQRQIFGIAEKLLSFLKN